MIYLGNDRHLLDGNKVADYECECGKTFTARIYSVKIGKTKHCGCKKIKHGLSTKENKHPVTNLWSGIKARCFNSNSKQYKDYGGRGITMQIDWKDNMGNFYKYISNLPNAFQDGYSLDRINNDGNYESGNLRWATRIEQNNNRRERKTITGYDRITKDRYLFKIKVPLGEGRYKCYWAKTIEDAVELRDKLFS